MVKQVEKMPRAQITNMCDLILVFLKMTKPGKAGFQNKKSTIRRQTQSLI